MWNALAPRQLCDPAGAEPTIPPPCVLTTWCPPMVQQFILRKYNPPRDLVLSASSRTCLHTGSNDSSNFWSSTRSSRLTSSKCPGSSLALGTAFHCSLTSASCSCLPWLFVNRPSSNSLKGTSYNRLGMAPDSLSQATHSHSDSSTCLRWLGMVTATTFVPSHSLTPSN